MLIFFFILFNVAFLQGNTVDSLIEKSRVLVEKENFTICVVGNSIVYIQDTTNGQISEFISLHIIPEDSNSLSSERRQYNSDVDDIYPYRAQADLSVGVYKNSMIYIVDLPNYPIAFVRTGPWNADTGPVWNVFIPIFKNKTIAMLWQNIHNYFLIFAVLSIIILALLFYIHRKDLHSIPQSLSLISFILIPFSIWGHTLWISYAIILFLITSLIAAIIRKKIAVHSILMPFVFMYLYMFIALFYSPDRSNGMTYLETGSSLILFPIIATCMSFTKEQFKVILKCFLAVTTIGVAFCLLNFTVDYLAFHLSDYNVKNWMNYPFEWLSSGHPSYYAIMALFAIAVTIYLFYNPDKKWLSLLKIAPFVFFFGVFIFISGARVAMLALPLVLGISWIFYSNWKTSLLRFCISAFLLILGVVSVFHFFPELPQKFVDPYRVQMWTTAIHSIGEHPLLGLGTGGVPSVLNNDAYAQTLGFESALGFQNVHNQYLSEWMQYGLIFGSALLVGLIWLFVNAVRKKDFLLLAFLIIEICFFQVECVFSIVRGIVFFMWVCTLLVVTQKERLETDKK